MTSSLTQKFLQGFHLYGTIPAISQSVHNTDLFSSRSLRVPHLLRDRRNVRKICSIPFQNGHHTENIFSRKRIRQQCKGVCDNGQHDGKNFVAIAGGTVSPQRLRKSAWDHYEKFSTSVHAASKFGVGGSDHEHPETSRRDLSKDWALRLANENGYLSWCRNTYLTTVVALAMIEEGKTAIADQAAKGALVVAALNLTWGTYQYIYNVVQLRHKTGMSLVGVGVYTSLAVLHLALWVMVCAVFLGYTQDPGDTTRKTETEKPTLEQ